LLSQEFAFNDPPADIEKYLPGVEASSSLDPVQHPGIVTTAGAAPNRRDTGMK
jgi:hypothetical protein